MGRVQTDADWNEQIDIHLYHDRTALQDIIGRTGAPRENAGFEIKVDPSKLGFLIGPGRYYVDGILCENESETEAANQPDLKSLYFVWNDLFENQEENKRFRNFLKKTFTAAFSIDWIDSDSVRIEKIENGKTLKFSENENNNNSNNFVSITLDNVQPAEAKKASMKIGEQTLAYEFPVKRDSDENEEHDKLKISYSPSLPAGDGFYIAYLDVWEQHVTWHDDPEIREVALGGPDTATRTKVVWQVKLLHIGKNLQEYNCVMPFPSWTELIEPSTATLRARAQPTEPAREPCELPPGGGYRRLENQLYRVEIHDGGTANDSATFKWSRDNGSWVARIADIASAQNKIVLRDAMKDSYRSGFAPGQWLELIDQRRDLWGIQGTLVQIQDVQEDNIIIFNPATVRGDSITNQHYPQELNPKVRKWDSAGAIKVEVVPANNNGYIELEEGVQVQFSTSTPTGQPAKYSTGNYWLIPARTVTNNIEWPSIGGQPEFLPAEGINHHYCRLALLRYSEEGVLTALDDCRHFFLPISSLSLSYVGGDGQEGPAGERLPADLQARVTTGDMPVNGVQVRFHIETGQGGRLEPPDATDLETSISKSDENGIVKCSWIMGNSPISQQVKANILDIQGNAVVGLPVYFNANLVSETGQGGGRVLSKTGVLKLMLHPPPKPGAKEVIFTLDGDKGFFHDSGELETPPAIMLGLQSLKQDEESSRKTTVEFMEDYEIFRVIRSRLLFKAVSIDLQTFKVSIEAGAVRELLALGKKFAYLRWWAISAEKRDLQVGNPADTSRIPTIVAEPSTISISRRQPTKISVFDPARNTDPQRPEEFDIRIVGESEDLTFRFVPVPVHETEADSALFANNIRAVGENRIQVGDNNPVDLPGVRAGRTIVALYEIAECQAISAEIRIVE
jgi:hypothetical protein